jgi:AraC-like DNA-binding protein
VAGLVVAVLSRSAVSTTLDAFAFPVAAYVLATFALRAPEVFTAPEEALVSPPDATPAEPSGGDTQPGSAPGDERGEAGTVVSGKYQKSRLPDAILNRYEAKLAALMKEKRTYLENELTLPQLAGRLNIPAHHLSQLLNERLGVSFFDYVNQLRIGEVKRLLRNPKRAQQSILDLALEAGFSSKSSFNAFFKRATGHSPSAYRKLSSSFSISQESGTSAPMGPDDTLDASL